jgi:hypothetical protein
MTKSTMILKVYSYYYILLIFFITNSFAQHSIKEIEGGEKKTWETKQIDVIRSLYLDANGMPSHEIFLRNHGIFPMEQTRKLIPYFSVTFLENDVKEINGEIAPLKNATPLNLDFFVENLSIFTGFNISKPIWEGRVYEENNKIIVGGYSSKFNERPVGEISNNGRFIAQIDNSIDHEFPILQIPTKQIVFDPFRWQLLKVMPNGGQKIEDRTSSFLPIKLFDQKGKIIVDIHFSLESRPEKSLLILYGDWGNKRVELAKCQLSNTKIIELKTGYQPTLIDGCIQPANGKVITFTFEGEFSDIVVENEGMLQIKNSNMKINSYIRATEIPKRVMKIDGQFQDWRNITGVSDPKGDFVSYLYLNPDTDILEAKVTNDERYLYLYSRVVGAHGRTGNKGRYYFYAYIDVDANPKTGYSPTRDDNCYFGVAIGDDCEAQFEFIGNHFVKTFFGFTGVGAEKEVLNGKLQLGPSYYSPKDRQGNKRDRYKIEYVNRQGSRFITHDYTKGTSEDIIIALSPDGSEVEMRVDFTGFLSDETGKPLMYRGRKINLSIGVEASSDYYGNENWGADSTPVIYGYEVK